jgi:hypothetical protein
MHKARTLVTLEPPLREAVRRAAIKEHVSISSKCRDLIRHSLELEEDTYWNDVAAAREKSAGTRWLSHDQAWAKR